MGSAVVTDGRWFSSFHPPLRPHLRWIGWSSLPSRGELASPCKLSRSDISSLTYVLLVAKASQGRPVLAHRLRQRRYVFCALYPGEMIVERGERETGQCYDGLFRLQKRAGRKECAEQAMRPPRLSLVRQTAIRLPSHRANTSTRPSIVVVDSERLISV